MVQAPTPRLSHPGHFSIPTYTVGLNRFSTLSTTLLDQLILAFMRLRLRLVCFRFEMVCDGTNTLFEITSASWHVVSICYRLQRKVV
jgi:hypothetical protein